MKIFLGSIGFKVLSRRSGEFLFYFRIDVNLMCNFEINLVSICLISITLQLRLRQKSRGGGHGRMMGTLHVRSSATTHGGTRVWFVRKWPFEMPLMDIERRDGHGCFIVVHIFVLFCFLFLFFFSGVDFNSIHVSARLMFYLGPTPSSFFFFII